MTIEELLSRLEGVKKQGKGYQARCPAHEDKQASLAVSEGRDGIVLKCFAGCPTDDILDHLNLQYKDLFYEPREKQDTEPESIYHYVDEDGKELFQAVRFPGKKFRQRHKNGGDDWEWNLDGVRRVLYQLPNVLRAVEAGETIYIAEGEKDVHRLMGEGKTATCNPMGAGKWRAEYSDCLRGAKTVIIVSDRDDPGREHANQIKESLQGLVEMIWIVQAKRGKDVSDHLDAGLAIEDLVPVRQRVRRGILTARELADGALDDLELTEWDIPGYVLSDAVPVTFRQGRMYAVGAYTGDGKTRYALQGTRKLCSSGARVGYASLEMPERDLRNGLIVHTGIPMGVLERPWEIKQNPELLARYNTAVEEMAAWQLDIVFDSSLTAEKIVDLARDREWHVVVVDHVHRFGWGTDRRTLEAQVVTLTNLALEQNVMVLLLCQLRKQSRGAGMEVYPRPSLADFRETSQIADDASMALAIWRQRDSGGTTYTGSTQVIVLKNRHTTGFGDQAGRVYIPGFDMDTQMLVPLRGES